MVPPSPELTESFPTAWSLLWTPPPLLRRKLSSPYRRERPSPLPRLMPRLTQRLTHGCIITVLVMLPVLMDMDIMVITWDTVWVILRTTTDMLHTVITIWDTMERGTPRLNQLPRLLPKLPQRPTPGCTIAMLVTDSTLTDMATTAMVWAMPPMPDITPTRTMVAAEMAMEPWFPAPPGNSVEVSALVLLK